MMKVLLDTNVILDALLERKPFDKDAKDIILMSENDGCVCSFTATAATDLFYLYSKQRGKKAAKDVLAFAVNKFEVIAVDKSDCLQALALPNGDFEDAMVEVCAQKSGVDYIVSRDEAFINAATAAKIITPANLMKKF